MPTIRISSNKRNVNVMEWLGAPNVDKEGHIERSLDLPEEVYQGLEKAITSGAKEGDVYLKDGARVHWFFDK